MVQIPDEYMRPEMMAIGDSLYQGVRSLTIKNGLNQLSASAQVAEAPGHPAQFQLPGPAPADPGRHGAMAAQASRSG